MKIQISGIIRQVMAESAMAAVLDAQKCSCLLTTDNEALLRLMVKNEFCGIAMELAPALSDIDFGGEDTEVLTIIFSDPAVESDAGMKASVERLLAASVLAHALGAAGMAEGELYGAMRTAAIGNILSRAGGLPGRIGAARY